MIRHKLRYFIKTAEVLFAFAAVVLLLTSLGILYASWQFSKGPVDITWAQPYVQKALGGGKSGIEVKAQGIVAEWKNFKAPLTLGIADLSIHQDNAEILSVRQTGLQLAKLPLFIGIVSPEALFIKNPSIHLEKKQDGRISFLVADHEPNTDGKNRMTPEELGESLFLGNVLHDPSRLPLSRLESVVINKANITINDESRGKNFSLPGANLTLNRDSNKVNIALTYDAGRSETSEVNFILTRDRTKKETGFLFNLKNVETGLWALTLPSLPGLMKDNYSFNGQITGLFGLDWTLKRIDGDIATSFEGQSKQGFKIAAERDPKTGIIPVELSLGAISLDQIASVWPDELSHLHITEWFTKKLSKGVIKNIAVTVPFRNEQGKWLIAGNASGKFDFENLDCDYRAPLYPLSEGFGQAVIADDTLTITIDHAKMKNIDVSDGSVVITKLTADKEIGEAIVSLHLKGPLSTAFKFVTLEPISLGAKIKVDPDKVEGSGDIKVKVTFPTLADLPADQVVAVVDANMIDTKLPGIVHGMTLSGGPLALKVEKGQFTISGNGALDGTPLDFSYSEYLNPKDAPYATTVKAKLTADDIIRKKLGVDLSDYISGKVGVDMGMVENVDGTASIDVKADLTPGQTFVTPLNYFKKEGVAGSAVASIALKNGMIQKVKNLNVTIGKDAVTGGELQFGTVGKENNVTAAAFEKVKLGDNNDFKLKIEQDAALLKLLVTGASIDARPFLSNKKDNEKPRSRDVDATIQTATLRMGDNADQILTNPNLRVVVNPAGEIKILDLKARAGQGDLTMQLGPDAKGVMALKLDASDAGAALNALGAYQNTRGGTWSITGSQVPGGKLNDIQGTQILQNFKVVKAPALARLIGAFSITGLPELLANEGISFKRLKSNFVWKDTPEGKVINLYDGATSGGSVGLTFGGLINLTDDTLDLSGTFVPISQINKVVSSIPLVGKLLTGGKNGGVIAATYAMKGPTDNPSVFVNPLSVLAPGFLRSILFEGGMNSGQDEKPMPASDKEKADQKAQNRLNKK